MLWTRIVGVLVLLVAVTYLVQWLVPRGGKREIPRKQYLRWDIAPIVGFFGALLLALSFAQAATSQVIEPWAWGDVFGLLISAGAWVLFSNRQNRAAHGRPSVWQSVRRYSPLVIAGVIGIYLAVRVFGAALEVFVAAALGTFVIAAAVAIFVGNKSITGEQNGK
jgi:hypothetical protein